MDTEMPTKRSLGNHEFDEAVAGVTPFIRNLTSPVVAANLILDKVPELEEEKNLHKSIVILKKGVRIGIIGYLTTETKFLAPKNNVDYEDEVTALKREVKKLKHQGVNILIALGHSGFIKDLEIAKYVDDIDLVIGGHSNTFLLNNSTDEIPEKVQGHYPTEVKQASGRIVRVVQAYAYTKYLGKLNLIFDSEGEIVKCDGAPILLNQQIPRDPEVLAMVNKYRTDIDKINNVVVGSSSVTLHGQYCRLRECNLGDLITDAIMNYTKFKGHYDVNIAVIQGGRIRASIDRPQKPFEITRGDWITVLPFSDSLTVLTMNGSVLLKALEHAVEDWRKIDSPGQFLQFSGMRVVFDLARPPLSRVVSAKAVCSGCDDEYSDVKDDLEYKVITCTFLAEGGDGFKIFESLPREIFPYNEVDAVLFHLNGTGTITQKEDGRLVVRNEKAVIEPAEAMMNRYMGSKGIIDVPNEILHCLTLILALLLQFRF